MATTLNLGELQVRLSASTAGFDAQFRSAQQVVSNAAAQMQRGLNDVERTMSGLIVPAGSLTGKLEVFSGAANKAGAAVEKMGKHVHGAEEKAQGLIGTLSGMEAQMNLMMGGAALSTTLTAPFVLFAKSALDASIGFEDAFAGVRKTVDATEQEFGQIEDRFRSMAKTTPITANEFARIGELAGQLGVRGVDNLTGFTDVVAKMGVTTNLATDEAATSLARFANIMQMPLEQADRLGSTIVDLGNNLATTEQEITQFALRIAGAGKQVGLSEAQVLGFGAALSSVGINAEAGGTAISRVFAKLAVVVGKGGDDLKMFANVAGVSAQDFAKAFKEDAAGATIAFIEGLKRIQDSGGNVFTVLEKLELEDIRVRDALLRTAGAGDVLRKSIDLASKAWESNTALNVEAAKRFDTTASRLQIMQNNFEELGRRIADTFAPAINGVIGAFNDLFESLQNMPPLLQGLLVGVSGLAAALGPLMLGLAGFGAVAAGIKAALPVLGMLWAAVTGPAGLATVAIAGLIVGIGTFVAANKRAREETAKQQESLIKLSDRYEALTKVIHDSTRTSKEHAEAAEEQKTVISQIGELFPDLVSGWDDNTNAVSLNTDALRENAQAARDSQRKQAESTIKLAQDTLERLRKDKEAVERQLEAAKDKPITGPFPGLIGGGMTIAPPLPDADKLRSRLREIDGVIRQAEMKVREAWMSYADATRGPDALKLEDPGGISLSSERALQRARNNNQNETEEEETGKRVQYLEEFERAFDRSQEDMLETFKRAQEDATGTFKDSQEQRLRDFQTTQDRERTDLERALDRRKDTFSRLQDDEKAAYQRHQDDLLRAFKRRQEDELDALRERQLAELATLDADFKQRIGALEGQREAIRLQEEEEERARRQEELIKRINKAQGDYADALTRNDPVRMREAEERILELLAERRRQEVQEQRRLELERIAAAIEGLRTEREERLNALKAQHDDQRQALQDQQATALLGYQRQLEDEKRIFTEAQAERKRQFDEELADQKQALADKQKEQERYFKDSLEFEMKEWKRTQDDRTTRYKRELDDLHDSFSDKLAEQQKFLQNWNAMAAQMSALVPGAGGELKLPDFNPALPGGGGGGGAGRIFAMAEGGILKKPIFAAGEAGPEIVAPLSKLDDLMAPMLNRVLDYIGGIGRLALGGDMQPVMSGVGDFMPVISVHIGERQLEDIWVEMKTRAERRGRA